VGKLPPVSAPPMGEVMIIVQVMSVGSNIVILLKMNSIIVADHAQYFSGNIDAYRNSAKLA
jgi:hypothetical protein